MEEAVNKLIQMLDIDRGKISDGYHTFDELYEHRHALFITLANKYIDAWKSRKHNDGSEYEGWFIAGIGLLEGHQVSYHLPDRLWDKLQIEAYETAPVAGDGHTSHDVIERLYNL